jgi:hypothetical protein
MLSSVNTHAAKRWHTKINKNHNSGIKMLKKHNTQNFGQADFAPVAEALTRPCSESNFPDTRPIRALSAHSAAEFNSSPGRWQHVWLVAIVPPERWGKMDRNDCHTAWGNFKTLISSLNHSKNYACSFSFIDFLFYFYVVFLYF